MPIAHYTAPKENGQYSKHVFYIGKTQNAFKSKRGLVKVKVVSVINCYSGKVDKRNLLLVSVICVKAKIGGGNAITVPEQPSMWVI